MISVFKVKDKRSGKVLAMRRTQESAETRKQELDEQRKREHEVVEEELSPV